MSNKTTFLFFDTETTGLPNDFSAPSSNSENWPRLVQLAWIITDSDGNHIKEREYIVRPEGFSIPEDVLKIHGITTERALKEGRSLQFVLVMFCVDLENANFIVGHNISFDIKIVSAEFHRTGIYNFLSNKPKLCTKKAGADICKIPNPHDYEGYKRPKLTELHRYLFNEDFSNAHNAMADIQATERCFWEMKRMGVI
ncbi:3'-5' exonuclease [uncultured Draconibacterium sp.]|uniref:3'-5' exonuclease n=1 Tax=uncultured Draconibacterium sp. TaxID=1573823 RepID=UPI0025D127F6|nr:3'-5' exonuclease [uncultured Draconibacterium sp.]